MTTDTHTCPHGRDIFEGRCTLCERDHEQYVKAVAAVDELGKGVNGGNVNVTAAAFGREHAYLFNELATAVALSTLLRTYDNICPLSSSTVFPSERHPEHDGRLGCGTVIGALRTLAVKPDEDVLSARKFWLSRIYQLPY
jgi:hypothetical protein